MFDHIMHLRTTYTIKSVMGLASKNEHIHTRTYEFNVFSVFIFHEYMNTFTALVII